ncbi:NADPH-dependent F420 reductase [mine drainage metagenome]|uniref:NADPH-dependent F420 reductase n=1 Tax=mine drainage metagenome TaxID=410659 RepID=T1AE86_9ZZZZ
MVVAAGHHLPAGKLCDRDASLSGDILVCGDHRDAKLAVIDVLSQMSGFRVLDVGSLSQAGALESLTAVLINLNIGYGGEATIRIEGLGR